MACWAIGRQDVRPRTVLVTVTVVSLLMLAAVAGCAGQVPEKPAPKPTASPALPTTPSTPTAASGPANDYLQEGPDTWHDTVHWLGIAGTGLAVLVALGGAVIYCGFALRRKPFKHPVRRAIRTAHICGGLVAVTLGLAHYVGRCVQAGEAIVFAPMPPVYAGWLFLIAAVSGILRMWPPKPLRKQYRWFVALHRVAIIGALYFATRHALYQIGKHQG